MANWIFQDPVGVLLIRCCRRKCQDAIFTLSGEHSIVLAIVLAQIVDNIGLNLTVLACFMIKTNTFNRLNGLLATLCELPF